MRPRPTALRWAAGLASCLAGGVAWGQVDIDDPAALAAPQEVPLQLGATLTLESAVGVDHARWQSLEAIFKPKVTLELSPDLDFKAVGRARADAFDRIEPGDPPQSEVSPLSRRGLIGDRAEFELRELYVAADIDRARLTVGKQQIVWGKADGLKVLDVVDPQDFRLFILDEFSESRIPLWSVDLEVPIDPFVVDVVWVPDLSVHDLPEPGGVFAFTSPLFVPSGPPGVPVVLQPPDRPRRVITDSDIGFRVATFLQGWDLTFNYLYHTDDAPVFARQGIMAGGMPAVQVTPVYRRTHVVGGTFSNAFGDLTVRGEVGAFLGRAFTTSSPADADGITRSDELSYVIGLDWYGLPDTLVSFQLFQSQLLHDEPGLARDQNETNVTLLLRHQLLHDTLTLETMWLHGVNRGDGLVRPRVSYQVDDRTTVWLGVDLFYGGGGGLFGQFDNADRLVVGVEWAF